VKKPTPFLDALSPIQRRAFVGMMPSDERQALHHASAYPFLYALRERHPIAPEQFVAFGAHGMGGYVIGGNDEWNRALDAAADALVKGSESEGAVSIVLALKRPS
jgi:hypothetical protein